jgi:hypothetical protein
MFEDQNVELLPARTVMTTCRKNRKPKWCDYYGGNHNGNTTTNTAGNGGNGGNGGDANGGSASANGGSATATGGDSRGFALLSGNAVAVGGPGGLAIGGNGGTGGDGGAGGAGGSAG